MDLAEVLIVRTFQSLADLLFKMKIKAKNQQILET